MTTYSTPNFIGRRTAWILLALVIVAALAIVIAPVWLIQPFKPQTARGLEVSYVLRRWSPWVTLVALVVSLILVARLWRGSRWWSKGVLAIAMVPPLAATWFAKQNHFEWMFHPLANSTYAKANDAAFVSDSDVVMSVQQNGEAVAYPIRLMAYHHVVQDTVGGTPIVATY